MSRNSKKFGDPMAVPTNPPGLSCQASRSGPIFLLGLFRVYETNLETLISRLRPFHLNGYAWERKTYGRLIYSRRFFIGRRPTFPISWRCSRTRFPTGRVPLESPGHVLNGGLVISIIGPDPLKLRHSRHLLMGPLILATLGQSLQLLIPV